MASHAPIAALADPLDVLRGLRRRWRLIAMVTVAVPLLAALALAHRRPVYRATGTLLYAPVDFSPTLLRSVVASARVTDTLMASQKAVIESAPSVARLVARLGLATRPDFNPALAKRSRLHRWLGRLLPGAWSHGPGSHGPGSHGGRTQTAAARRAAARLAAIGAARRALSVSVPPGSQLIQVGFTAGDPALAAKAANLAMRLYLHGQRNAALSTLESAESWLQTRATATAKSLGETDAAIARARAAAGTERGVNAPLTNQQAGRLADQLVSAKADLAAAEARLGTGADGAANAHAEAAAAPSLAPLQQREAEIAARLDSREADEGPHYPGVAADRRALASIRAHVRAATARLIAADRARVAADRARVATLKSELVEARGKASAASIRAAPIASLEQTQEAERSLLKALTEQIGTLESQSLLTRPDARIVSPAAVPAAPVSPPVALVLGGATLLGLALGGLAALAAEALDPRLRSGSEVRISLGRPCLALIPEVGRRDLGVASVADYARGNPFSPLNEQLRALRANLWLGAPPRSLAVTAARPGEGKTTVALSLAGALAGAGQRVLAIDCDIRQPAFDIAFDLAGAPGLTDVLAGRAELAAALHKSGVEGLSVMPAGALASDALTLFLSPALPELLARLKERFDIVILDLPPVFALADARVLARCAEATLFCIRWSDTPRRIVAASLAMLDEAGIRLAGTVLTRVDSRRHARAGFEDSELYHPRYGGYFRV